MTWLIVILFSVLGGFTQTVGGFGCVVVMMLVFPQFFPLAQAGALGSAISLIMNWIWTVRYRKYIDLKIMLLPCIIYVSISMLVIRAVPYINMEALGLVYGLFMLALAAYNFFLAGKIKSSGTLASMLLCCSISGIGSGLFGIGGPPLAVHFSGVLSREDYEPACRDEAPGGISARQATYMCGMMGIGAVSCVCGLATRIASGVYTADLIKYNAVGTVAVMVGAGVGIKVLGKINEARMKQLIYILVAAAGVLTTLKYMF